MSINAINGLGPKFDVGSTPQLETDDKVGGKGGFLSSLAEQIGNVNELMQAADKAGTEVALGRSENLHEAMITMEKAETSLKFLMQVRNKAIDAYNEILRMQV